MIMRKIIISFIMLLLVSPSVFAGLIVQPQLTSQYGFGCGISSGSLMGQTFTAEDAKIKYIGFAVFDQYPQLPFMPINIELFEGEGINGPLLGVETMMQSSDPLPLPNFGINPRFLEADFSYVTLKVGQVYTALITVSHSNSGVFGEYWVSDLDGSILQPDLYTGGYGFSDFSQSPSYLGEFDLVFRVVPIPEPSTIILLGLGAILLRRKK